MNHIPIVLIADAPNPAPQPLQGWLAKFALMMPVADVMYINV